MRTKRSFWLALIIGFSLISVRAARAEEDLGARAFDILKKNCFGCHGAAKTSGLDLRTRESMLRGGEHGPAVIPFEADKSRLWRLAAHELKPTMPPGKKLAEADIELLQDWIEAGAPLPEMADNTVATGSETIPDRPITSEERSYWAYRKPVKRPPPAPGNPIDAFLRAQLKQRGLKPAARANRQTLIRRAYLDLLGLPPTPEEVEAFVNDKSANAWPKLVDKLLASPHYGERWARHWLDLARFADSDGFEFDRDRPDAWRYRDYVVNAFNTDKPYNRFIKEQLAGDEYAPESKESMIATGYLRLGPSGGGGGERGRQDSLDDILTTTSLTFMGLTVGCARCHDHKFDPISQKDYYRMQAIFTSIRPVRHPLVSDAEVKTYNAEIDRIRELQRPLNKIKVDLEEPYRKILIDRAVSRLPEYLQAAWRTPAEQRTEGQKLNVLQIERTLKNDSLSKRITEEQIVALMPEEKQRQHRELKDQIQALERQKPKSYDSAMSIGEAGPKAQPAFFLYRGSVDAKGPAVTPGVLAVVAEQNWPFPEAPSAAKSSGRRRAFAEWLVSPDNPLTARVMVNRIWQHHFGEGLVRTPSNLGKMGERPSHPELLDWLAVEFMDRGWSVKAMHRLLMNSESYQMSSDDISSNLSIEPENRLWWRMPRARLEAEAIRDQILAVAGTLDRTMGGPPVFPYISPDLFQSSTQRTWPGKPDDDPSTWRRSVYVYSKRSIRYPMFETFDQPNLINSCERRTRSTIAPQALLLMNNNFLLVQARRFAERLRREAGDDLEAQVDRAFHLALGRAPSKVETAKAIIYVKDGQNRLEEFCQALFNLNEFVYRP